MSSFPARFWFVVGLLTSGTVVLVWAARSAYAWSGTHSSVARVTLFYLVVVVVALAWFRWWSTRRSVPVGPLTREEQSRGEQREAVFWDARVVLAVVWCVLALFGCVSAWRVVHRALREEPAARFLDFTAPALTLGWTMVMAALIMLLLVATPSSARPLRVISGAGGLAVGAAITALVFVSTMILPVEATTAEAPSPEDVAAPPARVSGVGWLRFRGSTETTTGSRPEECWQRPPRTSPRGGGTRRAHSRPSIWTRGRRHGGTSPPTAVACMITSLNPHRRRSSW